MSFLQLLPRFSTWTSRKSSPVKVWVSLIWWKCTEESSLWLKIFMIYAAEEPKTTRKLLLTFKITIWPKFLHVNAQFQTEVETLNWTCVTSTSFMLLRWISKHTTMLMTCCINSDLENWQRKRQLNLKENRAKRPKPQLPPDLTLVLFSFLWHLVLHTWHTEETTLISWTTSSST